MPSWRSQIYSNQGTEAGHNPAIVANAVRTGRLLQGITQGAIPVFTLNHLAHMTGVTYGFLRDCVERADPEPYRLFRIQKRQRSVDGPVRYRIICVPDPRLMAVQRWINENILSHGSVHEASVAFRKGDNIRAAAENHCRCKWMIKLDIVNFFESISEQNVYRAFNGMGYQPLVAFELARLCTRLGQPSHARRARRWASRYWRHDEIRTYQNNRLGHLPQGAPTSPMLANLVMHTFDSAVTEIATANGLNYTRYADDLTLSTREDTFSRHKASGTIAAIYEVMRRSGFEPNLTKTKIVPPGARKIVLGVLVNCAKPRLPKAFRDNLRQHLHYMTRPNFGPVRHAEERGFRSVFSLRNHVRGLIAYASQIDANYAQQAWLTFNQVKWP